MTLEQPQQNPSFQRVGDLQKPTHVAWDSIHNIDVSTHLVLGLIIGDVAHVFDIQMSD